MTGSVLLSPLLPPGAPCATLVLCDPLPGLGSVAGHLAGSAARSATTSAASAVFHALESGLATGAAQATAHMLAALFHKADALPLTSSWFLQELGAMARVTALVVVPLLMAATIGALVHQDPARLARTWLVWLPLAGILTLLMLPLVQAALRACDDMTAVVTQGVGPQIQAEALHLAPTAAAVGGGFLAALIGGLVLLGALAIWLEMVMRSSAIIVTVFFLPLILAGMVWPATVHMVRRAIEVLVALILSKFVVAAVLCLGVAAMDPARGPNGQPDVLAGVAILLLAAFAPMAVLRLVPVVEAAAIGHLEGRARQPLRAMSDAAGRAHRQLPLMARMLGSDDGAEGGGGKPVLQGAGLAGETARGGEGAPLDRGGAGAAAVGGAEWLAGYAAGGPDGIPGTGAGVGDVPAEGPSPGDADAAEAAERPPMRPWASVAPAGEDVG